MGVTEGGDPRGWPRTQRGDGLDSWAGDISQQEVGGDRGDDRTRSGDWQSSEKTGGLRPEFPQCFQGLPPGAPGSRKQEILGQ